MTSEAEQCAKDGSRGCAGASRSPRTVLDMVEATATANSNAPAVRDGNGSLSYSELLQRVGVARRRLEVEGNVVEGSAVGVLAYSRIETALACLAIWKCGGICVLLNPEESRDRLNDKCRQASIEVLVHPENGAEIQGLCCPTIDLKGLDDQHAAVGHSKCGVADSSAYIIFTSGSTGLPRGVEVAHSSLANYLSWARSCYADNLQTSMCVHTPLWHDFALTSFLLPLITGGTAKLPPHNAGPLGRLAFAAGDAESRVLKLTPGQVRLLTSLGVAVKAEAIVVGGELLRWGDVALLRGTCDRVARIYNEYGPTEATVGCVVYELPLSPPHSTGPVPIGRPIPGVKTRLVKESGDLVVSSEYGELFIGGVCLARGYTGAPELTRRAFIEPQLGTDRQYRTRDRCQLDEDGVLTFLGRLDRQVKIGGVLVDPSDVEHCLGCHDQVVDVHVASEESRSGLVLVAYVVSPLSRPDAVLREFAVKSLPPEMRPKEYVRVPRIPLKLSGKVDEEALALLRREEPSRTGDWEASTGGDLVATIWADILNVRTVSQDQSFFDLGGNSLDVLRAWASLRRELKLEIPITLFYEHPTLGAFCAALAASVIPLQGAGAIPNLARADDEET